MLANITVHNLINKWGEALYISNREGQEISRADLPFYGGKREDISKFQRLSEKGFGLTYHALHKLPSRIAKPLSKIFGERVNKWKSNLDRDNIQQNFNHFIKELEQHYKEKGFDKTNQLFPNQNPANKNLIDRFIASLYHMELDGLKDDTFKKAISFKCPKRPSKTPIKLIKNWK